MKADKWGSPDAWSSFVDSVGQFPAKAVAHGLAQGTIAEVSGGDFRDGFIGAAFSYVVSEGALGDWTPANDDYQSVIAKGVVTAAVGGTSAVVGGGKFANGAYSAAFVYAFNQMAGPPPPSGKKMEWRALNPALASSNVDAIYFTDQIFKSVYSKHAPNTNRTMPNSIFYADYVDSYESFVNKILSPVFENSSGYPSLVSKSHFPMQIFIDKTLPYAVGLDRGGGSNKHGKGGGDF